MATFYRINIPDTLVSTPVSLLELPAPADRGFRMMRAVITPDADAASKAWVASVCRVKGPGITPGSGGVAASFVKIFPASSDIAFPGGTVFNTTLISGGTLETYGTFHFENIVTYEAQRNGEPVIISPNDWLVIKLDTPSGGPETISGSVLVGFVGD